MGRGSELSSKRAGISKARKAPAGSLHTGWHSGPAGTVFRGRREADEKPAEGPWPHVPGREPTSLGRSHTLRSPLVPSLTFAAQPGSGSDPSPQIPSSPTSSALPGDIGVQRAVFSFAGLGLRACSSLLQRPSWARHPPPATRPRGPPLPLLARLWQALSPEALCSLIRKQAAGGLPSQSERFIVGFRGRLGAM